MSCVAWERDDKGKMGFLHLWKQQIFLLAWDRFQELSLWAKLYNKPQDSGSKSKTPQTPLSHTDVGKSRSPKGTC